MAVDSFIRVGSSMTMGVCYMNSDSQRSINFISERNRGRTTLSPCFVIRIVFGGRERGGGDGVYR